MDAHKKTLTDWSCYTIQSSEECCTFMTSAATPLISVGKTGIKFPTIFGSKFCIINSYKFCESSSTLKRPSLGRFRVEPGGTCPKYLIASEETTRLKNLFFYTDTELAMVSENARDKFSADMCKKNGSVRVFLSAARRGITMDFPF